MRYLQNMGMAAPRAPVGACDLLESSVTGSSLLVIFLRDFSMFYFCFIFKCVTFKKIDTKKSDMSFLND